MRWMLEWAALNGLAYYTISAQQFETMNEIAIIIKDDLKFIYAL